VGVRGAVGVRDTRGEADELSNTVPVGVSLGDTVSEWIGDTVELTD